MKFLYCTSILPQEYYEKPEEYSEDEEGQMVIDESPPTPASPENLILAHRQRSLSPHSPPQTKNNFNNNELKINSFGQGFANAINIWYVLHFNDAYNALLLKCV